MGKVDLKPLQEHHWQRGDATGWFEPAYAQAKGDKSAIPWADKGINPHLIEWAQRVSLHGTGQTALVIGCGLGDDAEYLATHGFAVTAFDISPTAVAWCRQRFPGSAVHYVTQDLFTHTLTPMDFVLEAHTLQALPRHLRAQAVAAIGALTKERLLVICRGCDQPEADEQIPWPLTREELSGFPAAGLPEVAFEDFLDRKDPPQRRFRVEYRRTEHQNQYRARTRRRFARTLQALTSIRYRMSATRYSILDLAAVKENGTIADSFRASLDLAQHAETLGFTRYWLAEHHNMAGIASAATAVLVGHIAGGTSTIRVGSGGIMLPNHAPLVIAEQFGTLETLYPGRIDLGLGRAPGTDPMTARALRRDSHASARDFPDDVQELLALLGPLQPGQTIRAVPGMGTNVPVWLLGSSTFSAQLAASLGLPFAFASHFAPQQLGEAIALYRRHFRPSQYLEKSYAMAGVPIIAADTDAEAQRLSTSLILRVAKLIRGEPFFIAPPVESLNGLLTADERLMVESKLGALIVGGPERIREGIAAFVEATGVDEIIFTSEAYRHTDRRRSFEIVAAAMQSLTRELAAV